MEENSVSAESTPESNKEKRLEIMVAIFLGLAALTTSWASWMGSIHGGNQSTKFNRASNMENSANSSWMQANQDFTQDLMLWNKISDLFIDLQYSTNNVEDGKIRAKYQRMLECCSDSFGVAVEWALDQDTMGLEGDFITPFQKEGYTDSYYTQCIDEFSQAEELTNQGEKDGENGDKFGLVTLVLSVVLFLLGIIGTFKRLPNRLIIMYVAGFAYLVATIYMFTIPMPDGFSFANFF